MVHIDTNAPDRDLRPGVDLWRIVEADEKANKAGVPMLKLAFVRVENPGDKLYDHIMLAGGGWPIGKRKLAALLPDGFVGDLDPTTLIGVRLWLSTGVETFNGRDSLKVMIDELKHAGMQREEDVPPGCAAPEESEIPF